MEEKNLFDTAFSPILKGKKFQDWVDSISNSIIRDYFIDSKIDLRTFLQARKVTKVSYEKSMIRGRLSIKDDGFELFLSEYLKDKAEELRFVVAHEAAHTYFYDIYSTPPRHLVVFPQGSEELEHACNILARSILLPKKILESEFDKLCYKIPEKKFQAKALMHFLIGISKKYQVHRNLVFKRVVHDVNFLKSTIIFEFKEPFKKNEKWNLSSVFISENLTKDGLFIPYPTFNKKRPTAREFISKIIDVGLNEYKLKGSNNFTCSIPVDLILKESFGNFSDYLKSKTHFYEQNVIEFHSWITSTSFYNPEKSNWDSQKVISILLSLEEFLEVNS